MSLDKMETNSAEMRRYILLIEPVCLWATPPFLRPGRRCLWESRFPLTVPPFKVISFRAYKRKRFPSSLPDRVHPVGAAKR